MRETIVVEPKLPFFTVKPVRSLVVVVKEHRERSPGGGKATLDQGDTCRCNGMSCGERGFSFGASWV